MSVNVILGAAAASLYFVTAFTGLLALLRSGRDDDLFWAAILSTFSAILFTGLYAEYLLSNVFEAVGSARDLWWATAHAVGCAAVINYHRYIIRGGAPCSND